MRLYFFFRIFFLQIRNGSFDPETYEYDSTDPSHNSRSLKRAPSHHQLVKESDTCCVGDATELTSSLK